MYKEKLEEKKNFAWTYAEAKKLYGKLFKKNNVPKKIVKNENKDKKESTISHKKVSIPSASSASSPPVVKRSKTVSAPNVKPNFHSSQSSKQIKSINKKHLMAIVFLIHTVCGYKSTLTSTLNIDVIKNVLKKKSGVYKMLRKYGISGEEYRAFLKSSDFKYQFGVVRHDPLKQQEKLRNKDCKTFYPETRTMEMIDYIKELYRNHSRNTNYKAPNFIGDKANVDSLIECKQFIESNNDFFYTDATFTTGENFWTVSILVCNTDKGIKSVVAFKHVPGIFQEQNVYLATDFDMEMTSKGELSNPFRYMRTIQKFLVYIQRNVFHDTNVNDNYISKLVKQAHRSL